jgi:hypothetical protein
MKQQLLSKLINEDGSIKFKFLNPKYVQKYLTPEELEYLKSCPGNTLQEKYNYLNNKVIIEHQDNSIPNQKLQNEHCYHYQGEQFDSSWQLAFWIYHKDHNHTIGHNCKKIFYYYKGKKRWVVPDFVLDRKLITIKGDNFREGLKWNKLWPHEEKALKRHKVIIIWHEDIKPFLYYVRGKYGVNYLKSFRRKTYKDYKRKIIPVNTVEEAFPYRNDNVRFSFICKKCGEKVATTYFILDHFKDFLCKRCRKKEGGGRE